LDALDDGRTSTRHGQLPMAPTWIWIQIAIVVPVLIGMVLAITKLA
jgi:hypothetical protein